MQQSLHYILDTQLNCMFVTINGEWVVVLLLFIYSSECYMFVKINAETDVYYIR